MICKSRAQYHPAQPQTISVIAVAYGVLIETLSKVAVARAEALPLFTAKPTNTFCAMVMVWLAPRCVQATPSAEV